LDEDVAITTVTVEIRINGSELTSLPEEIRERFSADIADALEIRYL